MTRFQEHSTREEIKARENMTDIKEPHEEGGVIIRWCEYKGK
ncbi:hypothetical protein MtrunA17_Chr2g0306471 [Medicago truncatula]|uniref:Uncharacterized protein n=1 Tax=Medicago truncatula TaxID=3880 RepID=A0A396J7D4_MEDTR|nr:hypothetical protein MtrunA17_Chr2g0306471 [Medicago truncatula]